MEKEGVQRGKKEGEDASRRGEDGGRGEERRRKKRDGDVGFFLSPLLIN